MTNCQATRLSAELAGDTTRKDNSHRFCVAVVVVVPVGTSVVKGVLAVGDSLAETAVGKSRVVDSLAEGSLRSYKVRMTNVLGSKCRRTKSFGSEDQPYLAVQAFPSSCTRC